MFEKAVIAENIIEVEPISCDFFGIVICDCCRVISIFNRSKIEAAGFEVFEESEIMIAVAVISAHINGISAEFNIFHNFAGGKVGEVISDCGCGGCIEHIEAFCAFCIGEVIALNGCVIVFRVDFVIIFVIGCVNLAFAYACAGIGSIGFAGYGDGHVIAVDCNPFAAFFGFDISVEHFVDSIKRFNGDNSFCGCVFAVIIGCNRSCGDGSGAFRNSGYNAVSINSCNGIIAAAPFYEFAVRFGINGSFKLNFIACIYSFFISIEFYGEFADSVIGIKCGYGPYIVAKGADLYGSTGFGLEYIKVCFFAALICCNNKIIVFCIIVHGTCAFAGRASCTGKTKTGIAYIGCFIVIEKCFRISIGNSPDYILIKFTVFHKDVIFVCMISTIIIGMAYFACKCDECHRNFVGECVMSNLITHTGGDIHNADGTSVVDDTDDSSEVTVCISGCRGCIGPLPGRINITVIGYFKGIGIYAIHVFAVVGIDGIFKEAASEEVIIFFNINAFPVFCIIGIEIDPFGLGIFVPCKTGKFNIFDFLNGDFAVFGKVRFCNGGGSDICNTFAHSGYNTGFAYSCNVFIGSAPGYALVGEVPGGYFAAETVFSADEKGDSIVADEDFLCDFGFFKGSFFGRNDIKTCYVCTEHTFLIIGNARFGYAGTGCGCFTGFNVNGIKNVIGAYVYNCCGIIKHVFIVIPCHGLGGFDAIGADVAVINIFAKISVCGIVYGRKCGNFSVNNIFCGPFEEIYALIIGFAVVYCIEVAFVVNCECKKFFACDVNGFRESKIHGECFFKRTGVNIKGINHVISAKSIEFFICGVIRKISDLSIVSVFGCEIVIIPFALVCNNKSVVGGNHEYMAVYIFSCSDFAVHNSHIIGTAHGYFHAAACVKFAGSVIKSIGVDFHPAVDGAAGCGVGECIHFAVEIINTVIIFELVIRFVAGIVTYCDKAVAVYGYAFHIKDCGNFGAGSILFNAGDVEHGTAGCGKNSNSCDILVIFCSDYKVAVFGFFDVGCFGSSSVNGEFIFVICAFADFTGIFEFEHIFGGKSAVFFVIFGNGHEAEGYLVAVNESAELTGGCPYGKTDVIYVYPGLAVYIIERGLELGCAFGNNGVAFAVINIEHEAACVTDKGYNHIAEFGIGADCSFVCGEGFFDYIGVTYIIAFVVVGIPESEIMKTAGIGEFDIA